MDFETARRVLLVASLEEADAEGELVPHELRRRASDAAPEPGEQVGSDNDFSPSEEAFLAGRAATLLDGLGSSTAVARVGAASSMVKVGGLVLAVAMLLIGYFSKELGPAGVVNILAFPLLGLMAWNLIVYAWMVGGKLLSRPGSGGLSDRVGQVIETQSKGAGGDGPGALFARRWSRVAAPVFGSRASAWLHLGAAALAIGAVAAMYWQGLVRDYRATWESTFLSAESVRGLLSVALAPATWLPGLAIPDTQGIEAIRAPGGERAAAWIHRYALAASVVVIVPRLLLAAASGFRARTLSKELPIRGEAQVYFKTLLASKRGTKSVVRVVPHRLELDPKQRDVLRETLHAYWGGDLWMDFLDSVAYGDEEAFGEHASELEGSDHIAIVCGRGATPEDESQGHLLRAVSAAAQGGNVLLVLEDAGFTERFGAARAAERDAAWKKLASGCGVEMLEENS